MMTVEGTKGITDESQQILWGIHLSCTVQLEIFADKKPTVIWFKIDMFLFLDMVVKGEKGENETGTIECVLAWGIYPRTIFPLSIWSEYCHNLIILVQVRPSKQQHSWEWSDQWSLKYSTFLILRPSSIGALRFEQSMIQTIIPLCGPILQA